MRRYSTRTMVRIETRAVFIGAHGPPDPPGKEVLPQYAVTKDEWAGWCMNYWCEYGGKKDKAKAPQKAGELAGWLAREIFRNDAC